MDGSNEVSLREYFEAILKERDTRYKAERSGDKLAVIKAEEAAKEVLELHNGLIRKMDEQQSIFARRIDVERLERFQSRMTGAMIILGGIGLTNLVKLWSG
jgi:hypothetical protein